MKLIFILSLLLSFNAYARQERSQCEEFLMTCDEVVQACEQIVNACDKVLESRTAAHEAAKNVIKAQEEVIGELTKEANHSHVPHVVGVSAFWVLLLLLL